MLIDILKEIEDPRSYHGKEYQLWQILLVSILSILSNGKTYHDIRTFLDVHYPKLNEIFKFNWRQLPDESAIRKIIVRVDPGEIERAFRMHAQQALSKTIKHLCFDGKTLNGSFSHTKDTRAARVFSAFCAQDQIVLAHMPLPEDKDHEIPAFQDFLLSLNLKDVVVTADAIHCQKKLSSAPILQVQSL
jgi:DDE_Tnp_1-associated